MNLLFFCWESDIYIEFLEGFIFIEQCKIVFIVYLLIVFFSLSRLNIIK